MNDRTLIHVKIFSKIFSKFRYLNLVYSFDGMLSKSDNRMFGHSQKTTTPVSRDITIG